eukprot:gene29403-31987_t
MGELRARADARRSEGAYVQYNDALYAPVVTMAAAVLAAIDYVLVDNAPIDSGAFDLSIHHRTLDAVRDETDPEAREIARDETLEIVRVETDAGTVESVKDEVEPEIPDITADDRCAARWACTLLHAHAWTAVFLRDPGDPYTHCRRQFWALAMLLSAVADVCMVEPLRVLQPLLSSTEREMTMPGR